MIQLPSVPKVGNAAKGYLARKKVSQNVKVIKVLGELLKPDPDPNKFWVNDKVIDGALYTGQIDTKVRSGLGRLVWPDKSYYEGMWMNDLANGLGILKHAAGD